MSDDGFTRAFEPGAPHRVPLGTEERVIARIHPSARNLTFPAVILVAASGGASYAVFVVPGEWQLAVVAGFGLVVVVAVLLPLLVWSRRRIILTSRRVLVRSGVLVRSERELALARLGGVSTKRGPFQALFRCADLRLRTLGSETLVLRSVPYPRELAEVIRQLSDELRQPYL